MAEVLNIKSIHLSFPYSVFAYLAAAVVLEAMLHFLPMGLVTFVAEKVGAGPKAIAIVFTSSAAILALLESATQAGVLASRPATMIAIGAFIYIYGLIAFWQLWKTGPSGCILMRIAFYLVWHVTLGPALASAI